MLNVVRSLSLATNPSVILPENDQSSHGSRHLTCTTPLQLRQVFNSIHECSVSDCILNPIRDLGSDSDPRYLVILDMNIPSYTICFYTSSHIVLTQIISQSTGKVVAGPVSVDCLLIS